MATEPRPRIERHEAEWFGFRRLDDFPHIDAHRVVDDLELIHERDIDGAEDVLGDLHGLGGGGGRYRHNALHHRAIEGGDEALRCRPVARHDLRDCDGVKAAVAGIFALGREAEKDIRPAFEAAFLKDRSENLVGRAGIGGGFENNELAGAQVRSDGARGCFDVGHIRLALPGQRRRNADDNHVALSQAGHIGCGGEALFGDVSRKLLATHRADVGLPLQQELWFRRIDVKAGDGEARARDRHRQRQPDVTEADDASRGRSVGKPLFELRKAGV